MGPERQGPAETGPRTWTSRSRSYGQDADSFEDYEYLFWVGCAGAFEDRAKKTTKAVAELLHQAGVKFAVLGAEETCTGDPARRAGNEFLFQQLAQQNVETAEHGLRRRRGQQAQDRRRPARTASTRSATSTRRSAATTRWSTTRSCSTTWCARRS